MTLFRFKYTNKMKVKEWENIYCENSNHIKQIGKIATLISEKVEYKTKALLETKRVTLE